VEKRGLFELLIDAKRRQLAFVNHWRLIYAGIGSSWEVRPTSTERAREDLSADDPPMLRPEEYTLPGIDGAKLPTEQEYIAETVRQAREGNSQASTEVLQDFVAAVDLYSEKTWPAAIPWPYARLVADKLATILNGDPSLAAVTLGIEGDRPSRRTGSGKYSHLAVAAFYFLLFRAGVAPKAAKSLTKERVGVSDDEIEEAVKEYPGFQYRDRFTVEILVELAAPCRGKLAETIAAQRLRLS
jgi:hypothetical protein